jgi:hypothetical protein
MRRVTSDRLDPCFLNSRLVGVDACTGTNLWFRTGRGARSLDLQTLVDRWPWKFPSLERPLVKRERLSKAARVKINRCHVGTFFFSSSWRQGQMLGLHAGPTVSAGTGRRADYGTGGGELGASSWWWADCAAKYKTRLTLWLCFVWFDAQSCASFKLFRECLSQCKWVEKNGDMLEACMGF